MGIYSTCGDCEELWRECICGNDDESIKEQDELLEERKKRVLRGFEFMRRFAAGENLFDPKVKL